MALLKPHSSLAYSSFTLILSYLLFYRRDQTGQKEKGMDNPKCLLILALTSAVICVDFSPNFGDGGEESEGGKKAGWNESENDYFLVD